ncbi:MAG: 16S rRNA (cytosine(967)-C(5))-methyltransferase RsmB [Clostridia bacterium]|nr:16S rRNA (cytosine(967)-C(5))-methyltransferase RsmB [Clostridia bacterium]
MTNARKTALNILLKIENDGAYSNLILNHEIKKDNLTSLDTALCSALVYGVLERKILLDYIIRQYTTIRLKKIEKTVLTILRMGIFQILFMDKIPDSAVVNESVKLAKNLRLNKSSGFINAVLRNFIRKDYQYALPDRSQNTWLYYSVVYSLPENMVKLWVNAYGEKIAVDIMENLMGRVPVYIKVNTLKTNTQTLQQSFSEHGIQADLIYGDNTLVLQHTGSVENMTEYQQGLFHIQDISSQICCELLQVKENMTVYDFCSAPGGKTFTIAEIMNNSGKVYAFDKYDHKVKLIQNGADRLGITNIHTKVRNALSDDDLPLADRVLCDVPCSGLGIIRRKPEIRYKNNLGLDTLPELQYAILCNCSKYVKNNGILIYSTCTLNPAENENNVKKFLQEHLDFQPLNITLNSDIIRKIDTMENAVTLLPTKNGSDGFFISTFIRKS